MKVFTLEIEDDEIELTTGDGCTLLNVSNNTSVSGTVIGTRKAFGRDPGEITIEEGDSYTLQSKSVEALDGITITAPPGCTLKITAQ